MNVGCTQLDGFLQQITDGTHNGCAAGKIAQAVDIIVGLGRIDLGAFWSGEGVIAELLRQRSRDIFKGSNGERYPTAEGELGSTHAGCIGGVSDDQRINVTCLELAWKDRHLAQEAVRKLTRER